MSKTYRRTFKGKKLTWLKRFSVISSSLDHGEFCYFLAKEHDWFIKSIPSNWNHDFHEVKFRAKNKNINQMIMSGNLDIEDAGDKYPQSFKKPHIYYW